MPHVDGFASATASAARLAEIRALLVRAFAGDFSDDDWQHTVGGRHIVVNEDGAVLAHAAVVPRVLEVAGRPLRVGYVEGVATDPVRQREGLGALAMAEVGGIIRREFEMGALSTGVPRFYAGLGWEPWRGPTYVRRGPDTIRTEADDEGVMVLRFGPSAAVDVTAALSCESRRGDDW